MIGFLLRMFLFVLLPILAVDGLRYWTGWAWWVCILAGIAAYFSVLLGLLILSSNLEDRKLKKLGLPLLDDRWPTDPE